MHWNLTHWGIVALVVMMLFMVGSNQIINITSGNGTSSAVPCGNTFGNNTYGLCVALLNGNTIYDNLTDWNQTVGYLRVNSA